MAAVCQIEITRTVDLHLIPSNDEGVASTVVWAASKIKLVLKSSQ